MALTDPNMPGKETDRLVRDSGRKSNGNRSILGVFAEVVGNAREAGPRFQLAAFLGGSLALVLLLFAGVTAKFLTNVEITSQTLDKVATIAISSFVVITIMFLVVAFLSLRLLIATTPQGDKI